MQFEDRTFDDSLADQESFPDLSDSNEEATKNYFTSKKANSAKAFAKPQNFKLTARTNTSKIYLPALKPFTEMGLLDDEWFCVSVCMCKNTFLDVQGFLGWLQVLRGVW